MNVNGYLFAAYCIIWIILFIYLAVLHRRQKEIGEQLVELSREVGDPGKSKTVR